MLKLPVPFGYYRFVLDSDHLHFGLWPAGEPDMSLEDAQELMFDALMSFFPSPPARVLDVGCGLGVAASLLAAKGFEVTAIAPSAELIAYARQHHGDTGVRFETVGFFDEHAEVFLPGAYDVLFFQESSQYLSPLTEVFNKARALLAEGGTIILGDETCYDPWIKNKTAVHLVDEFIVAFSEAGFRIMAQVSVGPRVAATCDVIINRFTAHFHEIVSGSPAVDADKTLLRFLDGWTEQREWYHNAQMGYELFVARKDQYRLRPYTAGDEQAILPMFNEIFRVDRTLDHWCWKFRDNPYGAHKITMAVSSEGTIVAHYAGYPVPFFNTLSEPKTFLSYQIGDTMTSPSVRNIGLGKTGLLARNARYYYAKLCSGLPFIYGFNTGSIKKLGTRYLGYVYLDPVSFRIRELNKRPCKKLNALRRLMSGLRVEEVREVGREWDELFGRVSDSYALLVKRDAQYVRWRYLQCPDRIHRVFVVRKRGNLIGWSVFSQREDSLVWGDALFDKDYREAVPFLLNSITERYYPGVSDIRGWFSPHPEWWNSLLEQEGFARQPEPLDLHPGFVFFADTHIREQLRDHWYYTYGDSDLF